MEVTIKLIKYHPTQQQVVDNARRFTTVNCGRRWGKNELAKDLLIGTAIDPGLPVAWFEPTYKSMSEVWREVKEAVQYITRDKSEQLKQIQLITGGIIDFWSLEVKDPGRGRKYKRVIVNEVAYSNDFDYVWSNVIRPTLTDYKGDAWFFSTPSGLSNPWFGLCGKKHRDWVNFTMPTNTNPFIPKEEIEAARNELHPLIFAQEYEAQFIDLGEVMFFYEFSEAKHTTQELPEIDNTIPLWFSFDFNVNPATAIIAQKNNEKGIFVHRVIQQSGGTRALCQRLEAYANHPGGIRATGDCSGFASSSAAGHQNDFDIIMDELHVSEHNLVFRRKANASHAFSRELCNSALFRIPVLIYAPACEALVYDLRTGQPTKSGGLLKDREHHKQDAGDAFRYLINAFFADYADIDVMAKNIQWLQNAA